MSKNDFKLGRCYERGLVFGMLLRLSSQNPSMNGRAEMLTLLAKATKLLEEETPLGVGIEGDEDE